MAAIITKLIAAISCGCARLDDASKDDDGDDDDDDDDDYGDDDDLLTKSGLKLE